MMNSAKVETFEEFQDESYQPEEDNSDDPVMVSSIVKENPYIRKILKISKLHVIHKKNVIEAFDTFGQAGLFHLFLPTDLFCNSIRDWTNQKIGATIRSKQYISSTEILAVVGLDIPSF